MRVKDVTECVNFVASLPVIGARYGSAIDTLREAWLRLLGREAMKTTVIESCAGVGTRICSVGVSVFVTERFLAELKRPPLRWVGPDLVERVLRGDSAILTDDQVREANSIGGLNCLVWEGSVHPEFEQQPEVYRMGLEAFIALHKGFLWKELIAAQMETTARLRWTLQTGGLLWDPVRGRYSDSEQYDLEKIIREPHLVGITRDLEYTRPGSWVGTLFEYRTPRCGFTPSQQELLLSAVHGATDEELARRLRVSVATVKKTWLSVYTRVAARLPELISKEPSMNGLEARRGKEKKRQVLAYVREHPEELRPVSRKLLRKALPSAAVRKGPLSRKSSLVSSNPA